MKLHEYQTKELLAKWIQIPQGKVTSDPFEAKKLFDEIGEKVVVKSQVLVGGRGKAGGVKLAQNAQEAFHHAKNILSMQIKGLPVRKVLIEKAANIEAEIYIGITNDRAERKPVFIASAAGGMDIEEVANLYPEKIHKEIIHPFLGLKPYQIAELAQKIELPYTFWKDFEKIAMALWKTYAQFDATMIEINPLIITKEQSLLALDAKMIIDDNALYRHADIEELRDLDVEAESETEARLNGLSFIKLEGNIGCMVNGAGLAMATMDMIQLFGGQPANFLDIGGGASAKKVTTALRLILADKNVRAVLFNIFGGITRCDEVAKGILIALDEVKTTIPMVIRLVGTNAEEGRELLAKANMITAQSLAEAAQKAVKAATNELR